MHATLRAISPLDELVAYEALWARPGSTLKSVSSWFSAQKTLPSEVLSSSEELFEVADIDEIRRVVCSKSGYSVIINGDAQFPAWVKDSQSAPHLLYYRGNLDLLNYCSISVVGSRKSSEDGIKRTRKLVKELIKRGHVIVSGLAEGVDTVALETAIENNGVVVGVIGTPIDQYYPKHNKDLQDEIARNHLLLSHVPFYRYLTEPFTAHKLFFPQRNDLMAAISMATIIVEASETSGTLTQARACIQQGRKLFILESCFQNPKLHWPKKYEERGAIRVKEIEDIIGVI